MKVYAMTDIGRVRTINEDSYYAPERGECFCAVADGMGGHNAGEVASAMAVKLFSEAMRESGTISTDVMRRAVLRANDEILRESLKSKDKYGMGTTFSALAMTGNTACIAHVGDSRVYLIHRNAIMQITTDHTLVEEMVLKGLLTPREARVHPKRNIITRALGTEPNVKVDVFNVEMRPGDVFLLCSDGLTNHVPERRILEITTAPKGTWEEKLRELVGYALEDGGQDNITALYAVCEGENG